MNVFGRLVNSWLSAPPPNDSEADDAISNKNNVNKYVFSFKMFVFLRLLKNLFTRFPLKIQEFFCRFKIALLSIKGLHCHESKLVFLSFRIRIGIRNEIVKFETSEVLKASATFLVILKNNFLEIFPLFLLSSKILLRCFLYFDFFSL